MRTLNTLFIAVLALFLAVSLPAYSQDRDEGRPAQQDKDRAKDTKKDNDKVNKQEDRDHPAAGQNDRHDADRQQDRAQEKQEKNEQRHDERMENNQQQHQHPAAAKQGKKIPDEKFRASFGRQHTFKVQRTQIINNPQPVVVYGGYNFQLVEAWPSVWSFDDPVYVDYDDMAGQYYMIDPFHPEVRIAVLVVGGF